MIAVLVELDLHIPTARSLKDKRSVIRRLINRLRTDLRVSVAEVAHHDKWQRCGLGVAIATSSETEGRKVAANVERLVARTVEVEQIAIAVEVVGTSA